MPCESLNINCVFSDHRGTFECLERVEGMLPAIMSLNEEKNGSFLYYDEETVTW